MKKEYLIVNTITNAIRAQERLQKSGFRAYVTRLPRETAEVGCGYCVVVTQDAERAQQLLKQAGIRVYGVRAVED